MRDLFDQLDEPLPPLTVSGVDFEPIVTIQVELPHPDVKLVEVGLQHDGSWRVVMRDVKSGYGGGGCVVGRGPDPLSASRSVHAEILEFIQRRVDREKTMRDAAGAARRAVKAPEPTLAAASRTPPSPGLRVASASVGGGVAGAPRAAAVWERRAGGHYVELRPGFSWDDTGTSEPRYFQTLRRAKDDTRAAVRIP